jgi:hypothetical protein
MKLSKEELLYVLEGLELLRYQLKEDSIFDYYAVWGLMDDVRIELNKR